MDAEPGPLYTRGRNETVRRLLHKEYSMLTLGPHLSQNSIHFREQLRQWQPRVSLVLMDVIPIMLDSATNVDSLNGKNLQRLDTFLALKSYLEGTSGSASIDVKLQRVLGRRLRDHDVLKKVADLIRPIHSESSLNNMKVIGRLFIEDAIVRDDLATTRYNDMPIDGPEETAFFHHHLVLAVRSLLWTQSLDDRVHYWVLVNEVPGDAPADLDRLARYEKKRLDLVQKAEQDKVKAEQEGDKTAARDAAGGIYGCGLFAYGTGNPALVASAGEAVGITHDFDSAFSNNEDDKDDAASGPQKLARWRRPAMHAALSQANTWNQGRSSARHVVLLHQYFKPDGGTDWVNTDYTLTAHNYAKQVGRFEHHVYDWFKCQYPDLKVIMSEYGLDGRIGRVTRANLGWKAYGDDSVDVYDWRQDNAQGENRYVAALKALDQHNQRYADVIEGYCIFCLGSSDPTDTKFWSYRLDAGTHAGGGSAQILTDLVAYSYSLAPQNVRAVVTAESVTVSWEPPELDGVTGYRVWRGTSPAALAEIRRVGSSVRSFTDVPTSPLGTLYYYAVSGLRTGVECRRSGPVDVVTGLGTLSGGTELFAKLQPEADGHLQFSPGGSITRIEITRLVLAPVQKTIRLEFSGGGFEFPYVQVSSGGQAGWLPFSAVTLRGLNPDVQLAALASPQYLRVSSWVTLGLNLRTGAGTAFAVHALLTDTRVWYEVVGAEHHHTGVVPDPVRCRFPGLGARGLRDALCGGGGHGTRGDPAGGHGRGGVRGGGHGHGGHLGFGGGGLPQPGDESGRTLGGMEERHHGDGQLQQSAFAGAVLCARESAAAVCGAGGLPAHGHGDAPGDGHARACGPYGGGGGPAGPLRPAL